MTVGPRWGGMITSMLPFQSVARGPLAHLGFGMARRVSALFVHRKLPQSYSNTSSTSRGVLTSALGLLSLPLLVFP